MAAYLYPCPACGFRVFTEPPGSHDICPLCRWQDDPVQLASPLSDTGANYPGLFKHQREVLKKLPVELKELKGFMRDKTWRPLNEGDFDPSESEFSSAADYFEQAALNGTIPEYYWKKKNKP